MNPCWWCLKPLGLDSRRLTADGQAVSVHFICVEFVRRSETIPCARIALPAVWHQQVLLTTRRVPVSGGFTFCAAIR